MFIIQQASLESLPIIKAMFQYQEHEVTDALSPFIKKLWILNNADNCLPVLDKSILPNGCFNIAIIEGIGFTVRHNERVDVLGAGIYFCGQSTHVVSIDAFPFSKATMIQLYPWTPVHFTSQELSPYTNMVSLLELQKENNTSILNFSDTKDVNKFLDKLKECLATFYNPAKASRLVTKSTEMIVELKGNATVKGIATAIGCSQRHLQKIFKKHIGLSPKEFIVIIKLRETIELMAYPEHIDRSLTNLSLDNNYYDQAHFNNTFRAITNTSPGKFFTDDYLLSLKK